MKGSVLLAISLVIVLILLVSSFVFGAESTPNCAQNQTIMKLSGTTNAHGALYNYSNYKIDICYKNIFRVYYNGTNSAAPHNCNGNTNTVLLLAQEGIAHTYSYGMPIREGTFTRVCYGDLNCSARTTCLTGEEPIVSMSKITNAHLSSLSNFYPIKICCSSPSAKNETVIPPVIPPIIPTECAEGQLVCCAEGQTLCVPANAPPYCEIGSCENDEVKCNHNSICEQNESCQCLDCHGYQDACKNNLICNFRTQTCQNCTAGTIFDSVAKSCQPDPGISIRIIKPAPGWPFEKFLVNQNIGFEQISSNLKKDLSINWSFGDGSITSLHDCLTTENCNTTHSYSHYGLKPITAMAYEQGGLNRAFNFTDVLIYEQGINVFAIISEPPRGKIIPTGEAVYFNANKSYVANCSTTLELCSNSSGGSSCYLVGTPTTANKLYCYDFNVSKIGKTYDLRFKWEFDKGQDYPLNLTGTWSGDYNSSVEFHKPFFFPGNHTAELTVTYGYYI